jgi:hypothetical protein
MTAPTPPWTPEEDGLLRSMGAAGESRHRDCNAAQAQSGGGAPASAPTRDQVGPFAARAEAEGEISVPTTNSPDSTTDIVGANPLAARELLKPTPGFVRNRFCGWHVLKLCWLLRHKFGKTSPASASPNAGAVSFKTRTFPQAGHP